MRYEELERRYQNDNTFRAVVSPSTATDQKRNDSSSSGPFSRSDAWDEIEQADALAHDRRVTVAARQVMLLQILAHGEAQRAHVEKLAAKLSLALEELEQLAFSTHVIELALAKALDDLDEATQFLAT